MQHKLLEVRDEGTCFLILAIDMNPSDELERRALRSLGYPCDGTPNIMYVRADGDGRPATNDCYHHNDRTNTIAHIHITENWSTLSTGDVIDVQYILNETSTIKTAERF